MPTSARDSANPPRPTVAAALRGCYRSFLGVALFSGVINILMLTGPFFMLQVYDRVLASRSVPTLAVLLGLVGMLFAFQAVLDIVRGRILTRIGDRFDAEARPQIFEMIARPRTRSGRSDGLQPVRDLDLIRQFLGGPGPAAIFDLPWVPLYLAIVYVLHPWLGLVATAGAAVLCVFAVLIETVTRRSSRDTVQKTAERNAVVEACRLHGDYLGVMGMLPRFRREWDRSHADMLDRSRFTGDVSGMLGACSRVCRLLLQSLILAVGAYLVIQEQATGGVMIASSIIASRALAPIEQAISQWRMFLASRQAYRRLGEAAEAMPQADRPHALPAPRRRLDVANIMVTPPGAERPTFAGNGFSLKGGDALAILGPSGAGKSSLARGIVGLWAANRGAVRLDGATLDQWDQAELGRHVGYLAQDVELFTGTVAENIARFAAPADEEAVLKASRRAGVHELIVALPKGYDTPVGPGGIALSGGQRQRIALARALYGDPFLLVLDEPNSNLDAEGEVALTRAIKQSREAGSVVVVVAHRPSVLAAVDEVLVVAEGRQKTVGPKDEVLGRALKQPVIAGEQVA